ncbi:hypothetical protein UlMin_014179 [Ulmus minor]
MASSDEEGEIVTNCVTEYYFVNQKHELVSFASLPLQWVPGENLVQSDAQVFLFGTANDGLQKIYERVVAWKFDLSSVQPEISLLSKDGSWKRLQKPMKTFENTIRTILVTLHWLHFLKKNPGASGNSLWNYLVKFFSSSFEVEPSVEDLLIHMPLIREAVKRDKDLANCEYLFIHLKKPSLSTASNQDVQTRKSEFTIDSYEDEDDTGGEDYVCAICDNGGEILTCQGRCMRSFHATKDAGADTLCESLGYDDAQVKAIPTFICKNCKHQQHQCFACGKLGSSNDSFDAEVFPCASATCGHFFHPECVAKLLCMANKNQTEELQQRIVAGESFTCPAHICFVCQQGENKMVHDLQFALCRRCPKAYHRKCLPRSIAFERNYDENIVQRAWDYLLPDRILIYCMDHKIIIELGTPARDHIKFPDVKGKQKTQNLKLVSSKDINVESIKSKFSESLVTKRTIAPGCSANFGDFKKRSAGPDFGFLRKLNTIDGVRKSLNGNTGATPYRFSATNGTKLSMQNNSSANSETYSVNSMQQIARGVGKNAMVKSVIRKKKSAGPNQAEMEKGILELMKESTSSFDHANFIKSQTSPASNLFLSGSFVENSITVGEVEGSVMAIRTALKTLDEGCSIEDAKAVCEPDVLARVFMWKRKLGVYLAPFLHGMRYTSFGRHFTKVDKLQEVVNRLQSYVQNGDTIVDFCCGSNDFSIMMKEKLENTGKLCSFKNYDIMTPKNDFSFEQRDWMSVRLDELPDGSELIMGLNPPFGVKASLANRFIAKALEFRPKLLILIVPKETERLDQRVAAYDLIWEDVEILSGKSFYLPGSIDVNDKQLDDWNMKAPPLYLWSRRDWTTWHKKIAQEQGHIRQQDLHMGENIVRNYLMPLNNHCFVDYSGLHENGDIFNIFRGVPDSCETKLGGTEASSHSEVS